MPLRVTIQLVPGGNEAAAQVLTQVDITQVDTLADGAPVDRSDPGGLRRYLVHTRDRSYGHVEHRRVDGHAALVSKALGLVAPHTRMR